MTDRARYRLFTYSIAAVWVINGLFCKVLGIVPRHEQIVAGIAGNDYAWLLTKMIGAAEIIMALWILSGISRRFNALIQISVVALMNIIECFYTPNLLLWGRGNAIIALVFIGIVYYNTFVLYKKLTPLS